MKKIYLFLLMLVGMVTSLWAQSSNEYEIIDYEPLITDVSQLSSPYTETREGSLAALIGMQSESDHPNDAFWHSDWSKTVAPGTHYFQVEMPDGEYDLIAFVYTRRPNANNQTTEWSVYGTDEFDADKEDCTLIIEVSTPYTGSGDVSHTSQPFSPGTFRYLRFYSEQTNGQGGEQKGFFHVGQFQLYPVQKVEEREAALRDLFDVIDLYGGKDYSVGTNPGDYSEEAVTALMEAIEEANEKGELDTTPVSVLVALKDAIIEAYQAVIASRVPLPLPDGYYRIRAALQYTNDGQPVDKYIYSVVDGEKIYARWYTPKSLDSDAPSLWKVTNVDGYFDIVNVETNARFNEVKQSTAAEMSVDSENLMSVELNEYVEDADAPYCIVDIRVSTQKSTDYCYLHQGGHKNGEGISGDIVGWAPSSGSITGSEWIFDPLTDDEVAAILEAYEPIRNHDLLVERYHELLNDAQQNIKIAIDETVIELLSDVSQLSSPWTDPGEGALANLLDDNASTFWHSSWHDNPPHSVQGSHYLQVEMPEGYYSDGLLVTFQFTRRDGAANDHSTAWSVRGTNEELVTDLTDPLVDKEMCEELLAIETPFSSTSETLSSEPFDPKGYKYLRFYSEHQKGGSYNDRIFWHASEFRVHYSIENQSSQYLAMGELVTNLEAVIEAQADITDEELTIDEFDALKDAYDAFAEKFVDPSGLRATMSAAQKEIPLVRVGTQPGFWPSDAELVALQKTLEDATAYDKAGVYTQAQSDAFIQTIEAQQEALDKAVIPVREGKWYRIRFGTEEEYETYGWNTVGNGTSYRTVNGEPTEVILNVANYGSYMTVARRDYVTEKDENGEYTQNFVVPVDADEVVMNDRLFHDFLDNIVDPDMALFRFISVGDSAYIIQNKATGLFLQKRAEDNDGIRLSVYPSFFRQEAVGYGQNAFFIKTFDGVEQNPLHFALSQSLVLTFARYGDTDGRRGCLFVEEVEDVLPSYDGTAFKMALKPGALNTFCYPVSLEAAGGIYGVSKVEDSKVTLVPIKGAVDPGRAFICINGLLTDYDPEAVDENDDSEPVPFSHGYDFVAEPLTTGPLMGTFAKKTVGAGVLVAKGNALAVSKKDTEVAANGAYIAGESAFERDAEFTIVIDKEGEDAIAAVVAKVAKSGELYTIDGRLLSRKANLNDLKNYGKGVYILNGTKVTVK